jgi:hypothetical protein
MKKLIFIVLYLSLFGCMSSIDERWAELNTDTRQANIVFVEACISFIRGVDNIVIKKHMFQEEFIKAEWNKLFEEYKASYGLIPTEAVKQRYEQTVLDWKELEQSKESWKDFKDKFLIAVGQLRQAIISAESSEKEIIEAKESAQAYLKSALTILSGIAASAILVP